jgi:hypothetical protein
VTRHVRWEWFGRVGRIPSPESLLLLQAAAMVALIRCVGQAAMAGPQRRRVVGSMGIAWHVRVSHGQGTPQGRIDCNWEQPWTCAAETPSSSQRGFQACLGPRTTRHVRARRLCILGSGLAVVLQYSASLDLFGLCHCDTSLRPSPCWSTWAIRDTACVVTARHRSRSHMHVTINNKCN